MTRLQLSLLSLSAHALGLLPSRSLRWLSHALGRLAWRFSNTRRNTTLRNLAACFPQMDLPTREAMGRESMRHFVLTALETGMCWSWSRPRLERHFVHAQGLDVLEAARAEGRGVLALVPHFGNWELLNHWAQFRWDLMALYKPGGSPELEKRMVENRCRFGAQMVQPPAPDSSCSIDTCGRAGWSRSCPTRIPPTARGISCPFSGCPR